MQTPFIRIDLQKVEHNARSIVNLCKKQGVSVAGVTKGTLGMPEVAQAMLRGGVSWIGESRLDNIERLRTARIDVPYLLMRSPHLSEVDRVITLADISLNTEYKVIEALSGASVLRGRVHNIILMVDLGDLREGIWPQDVLPMVKEIVKLKGVHLLGLGTNLTDLNGTIPTYDNNQQLVELAEQIEAACNLKLQYLSAGNSSSLKLLASGNLPERINHFRIGEGILLGRETIYREIWPDTFQDAFVLCAEIIEKKLKPSVPIGEIGQDAFGNIPTFKNQGMMLRGIVNLGRQDANVAGLNCQNTNLHVLGATSDHLVLDLTKEPGLEVGDLISFDVNYGALLAAMTSPFVRKVVV